LKDFVIVTPYPTKPRVIASAFFKISVGEREVATPASKISLRLKFRAESDHDAS
jgi:hypothetical protein